MTRLSVRLALVTLLNAAALPAVAQTAAPAYHLTQTVPLGAPDKWDYLLFDQGSHRLFIAHGGEVTVVDGQSGRIVGRVDGLTGAHGVALMPGLGRGYATNNGQATAFDLTSLTRLTDIPTANGADAAIADPATDHVFVMNGKAESLTAIDPRSNTVLGSLALGGKPEFNAVDGQGALFVNIEDKSEVVRVDTASLKIQARWPIPQCDEPHGLAIDAQTRRLFVGCVNTTLLVLDADNGRVVATLPIGKGSDAVAFDTKRKLVFSSNGDGTVSSFAETGADSFAALPLIASAPGARTMAVDADSGRLFLVTADIEDKTEPQGTRRKFVPGTVKLLVLDPR
ncbi:MAG TPA: YncE family protein [Patescibacteria group bacterium]|nr:YncE family protein [Patescibacteria group bacterium]